MAAYYKSLLDRIAALPGIRSVVQTPIFRWTDSCSPDSVFAFLMRAAPSEHPSAACNLIDNGYLRALGIPLVQGREFDTRDGDLSPPVAI